MIKVLWITIFSVTLSGTAYAQEGWDLTKEKNGIKVFTARQPSAKYKDIKVEAVFPGTIQKLVGIITNIGQTKNWVYGTKESYIIKKINANEILYYSQTELPWPVDDRDIPIKMRWIIDGKNNSLKVFASGIPNAIPQKKGVVRIPYFNASWDVKFDGKNKLMISYILKMDPGGTVPSSMTNLFITKGPYETFINLLELLKS